VAIPKTPTKHNDEGAAGPPPEDDNRTQDEPSQTQDRTPDIPVPH
jgi:hypothetical protein